MVRPDADIDAPTIREAWSQYYDAYHDAVAAMDDVLIVRTEELDRDETVVRILDHLGIPDQDRVLTQERHHNQSERTVVTHSRLLGGS